MTQFHSDEYIDFLYRVTPSNMNNYQKEQAKCMFIYDLKRNFLLMRPFQTPLVTTVPCLTAYLIIVRSQLVVQWVGNSLVTRKKECTDLNADRGCGTSEPGQMRHCNQLGWWFASCKEIRGKRILLCERCDPPPHFFFFNYAFA
jgi:hypothetical protein